ncbi:MAG: aminotransferase class I/II-fold pyridoxal phosphate-dependent enzyme [Gammaproteobacteria bacterium]|nr:aminotransferase class I/II-fold pyridoxal phosphate-dependent enzyme [Gammaproteobacteria bacterium]
MSAPSFKRRLLEKVRRHRASQLYPYFRAIEEVVSATTVLFRGKKHIMTGSNNYLGLTHHPTVIKAAKQAIDKYGTGCTGSRFLTGNLDIHEELELKLAEFVGQEKVLLFSTGMQANLGALDSLCGAKDCLLMDSDNHASLIDGGRMALGTVYKYRHNNYEQLEGLLQRYRSRYRRMTLVIDGVFSMTGELAPLPSLVELAHRYDAQLYVDDAHGIGVVGRQGRGTANHYGLESKIDLHMGTFSKTFSSIGGFVASDDETIEYLRHTARSLIFSAAMPPSAVATVSACLDVIQKEDWRFDRLRENVSYMRKGFEAMGLSLYDSSTPIIAIDIGDEMKAMEVTRFLQEQHGIFVTPVIPPAVGRGQALIRTSFTASHTQGELNTVLEAFDEARRRYRLPNQEARLETPARSELGSA